MGERTAALDQIIEPFVYVAVPITKSASTYWRHQIKECVMTRLLLRAAEPDPNPHYFQTTLTLAANP